MSESLNKTKKQIIIYLVISGFLGLASSLINYFTSNRELLLAARLVGVAFFTYIYFWVSSLIKKQEKMVKESNGFIHVPFNPKILKHFLLMFIVGWTIFAVLDYHGLNFIDWILVYVLGITIFPFASGLIPLRLKDNKWRK